MLIFCSVSLSVFTLGIFSLQSKREDVVPRVRPDQQREARGFSCGGCRRSQGWGQGEDGPQRTSLASRKPEKGGRVTNKSIQAELFAAVTEANIQPWSKTSIHLYCELTKPLHRRPSVLSTNCFE